MEHQEYRGYQITPVVKYQPDDDCWLLEPKIYHPDLTDTIFHNSGELEALKPEATMADDENEATRLCFAYARQIVDYLLDQR